MVASLVVLADGRIDDASHDALRLLGVSMDELRSLPPGAFSSQPQDPSEETEFREAWARAGRRDIHGAGNLRLLDGREVRVRFSISPISGDRFLVVLEKLPEALTEPPRLYIGDDSVARWRPTARRLEPLDPASEETSAVQAEIARLRRLRREAGNPA